MDEIIDLIATDSSSSDVSDKIKDLLYTKAADKIESQRSDVVPNPGRYFLLRVGKNLGCTLQRI